MHNNFEYANATHDELTEWEFARLERDYIEHQAQENERYEESLRKSYEARGLGNIY